MIRGDRGRGSSAGLNSCTITKEEDDESMDDIWDISNDSADCERGGTGGLLDAES